MPSQASEIEPTPADRRREVASILARGVMRWRRRADTTGIIDDRNSAPGAQISLEVSGETRLSVGNQTRGLRLRDDGDHA